MANHTMPMLRRTDGLFERAAEALQRTVAADPTDAAALQRLGDVQRGLGRLGEALDCYRRVLALRPDDPKAQRLAAILGGKAPPQAPPDARPLPFVTMAGFLPKERCSELLAFALANRERFRPAPYAGLAQRKHFVRDPSNGRFLIEPQIMNAEVRPWFEAWLRGAFAQALPRLRMREPSDWRLEIGLTAYCGGGRFFFKHRDDGERGGRIRTLCYAYYFHRQPRSFSGGELLLHDDDGTRNFTRIEPQHNSMVFFPAACLHQVRPSSDVAHFADARFALNGWLNVSAASVGQ